jgi:hypothetical protein
LLQTLLGDVQPSQQELRTMLAIALPILAEYRHVRAAPGKRLGGIGNRRMFRLAQHD